MSQLIKVCYIIIGLLITIACQDILSTENVQHDLIVELIREPDISKVADEKSEYSWIVPQKALPQKSYQVLVYSSKYKSNKNLDDIWDSGEVNTSLSTFIEHDGFGRKRKLSPAGE